MVVVLLASEVFSAGGPQKVRVGMAVPSYAHGVLWIAQDAGFFEKEGLDVQVFVFRGSAASMRMLLAGEADIVLAGGDAALKADRAGADIRVFAGLVNRFYHKLVGRKELESLEDLKGRSVAVPFLGGPQDMAVRAAFSPSGLRIGRDVKIRNMGSEFLRLEAVRSGRTDAVTTDATPSVLEEMGLHVLADLPSWDLPFPYMMAAARQPFLEEREEDARRFLKALCAAMGFYAKEKSKSIAILKKRLSQEKGGARDPEESYAENGPSRYSMPPFPDEKGFRTVVEHMGWEKDDPGIAALEGLVDTRILDSLEGSGGLAGCGGPVRR